MQAIGVQFTQPVKLHKVRYKDGVRLGPESEFRPGIMGYVFADMPEHVIVYTGRTGRFDSAGKLLKEDVKLLPKLDAFFPDDLVQEVVALFEVNHGKKANEETST